MFVTFQVYKTFINKLYVICFICTVRKSNVLYSVYGSWCLWEYHSKNIQKLISAYYFFLLHDRTQTAITWCHPQKSRTNSSTQRSEDYKLPPQASWEHSVSDVLWLLSKGTELSWMQEVFMWLPLECFTWLGKADHLLLPQGLQWIAETQPKWVPVCHVLCEQKRTSEVLMS